MNRYRLPALATALLFALCSALVSASNVTIYPAPDKSLLSPDFTLQVDGKDVPVYTVKVAPTDAAGRTNAMDDKLNTAQYFERAAFAYFDAEGAVQVAVTYSSSVSAARLLPASPNAKVAMNGRTVRFTLNAPGNFTLEVNHELVRTLHIFVNPPETDAPSPHAANVFYLAPGKHEGDALNVPAGKTVIYFAPGMHSIDSLVVHDGQTLYIAGGAVVKAVINPSEPFSKVKQSRGNVELNLYKHPAITLSGSNIKLRGHGVLDGSEARGKYLLRIQGQNISAEGIILQDAGTWTIPVWYSDQVTLTNLKLLGYRANSDGIDIVSSRDVTVKDCFIRTLDDNVTLKTIAHDAKATTEADEIRNVVVENSILWGEVAHVLTIGTQVEAYIHGVTFTDDDIIHYLGRDAPLAVDLSGSATVGNVRYQNIRVDNRDNPFDKNGESRLIDVVVKKSTAWQRAADLEKALGKVRGVAFENIQATISSPKVRILLTGADENSDVQDVKFQNVTVNGRPLSKGNSVITQKFTNHVTGLP